MTYQEKPYRGREKRVFPKDFFSSANKGSGERVMSMQLRNSREMLTGRDRGCWSSRTDLEKKLIIVSGVLFLLSFSLIISIAVINNKSSKSHTGTTTVTMETSTGGEESTTVSEKTTTVDPSSATKEDTTTVPTKNTSDEPSSTTSSEPPPSSSTLTPSVTTTNATNETAEADADYAGFDPEVLW